MKKIVLLLTLCCLVTIHSFSQSLNNLEKVVELQNSKANLFLNAQNWATANASGIITKVDDSGKDNGTLVAVIDMLMPKLENSNTKYVLYELRFSSKIDCSDGKYQRSFLSPSVILGIEKKTDYTHIPTNQLLQMKDELKMIQDLSLTNFKESFEWHLDDVVKLYNENKIQIDSLTTKSSDASINKKDKKQLSVQIEKLTSINSFLEEVINRANNSFDILAKEIDSAMLVKK